MRWLRKFLYSDDPIVKVAGGLLEPEAEMWREILANEGIPSFKKLDVVAVADGLATGTNVGIFVKQSDVERAREVLAPLAARGQLADEATEEGS